MLYLPITRMEAEDSKFTCIWWRAQFFNPRKPTNLYKKIKGKLQLV